jgi:hypothetical protein
MAGMRFDRLDNPLAWAGLKSSLYSTNVVAILLPSSRSTDESVSR